MAFGSLEWDMISVPIGGEEWTVRMRSRLPGGAVGLCDYETRTITIKRGLNHADALGTAIHEAVHAAIPSASEAQVAEAERAAIGVAAAVAILTDGIGGARRRDRRAHSDR